MYLAPPRRALKKTKVQPRWGIWAEKPHSLCERGLRRPKYAAISPSIRSVNRSNATGRPRVPKYCGAPVIETGHRIRGRPRIIFDRALLGRIFSSPYRQLGVETSTSPNTIGYIAETKRAGAAPLGCGVNQAPRLVWKAFLSYCPGLQGLTVVPAIRTPRAIGFPRI